MSCSRWLIKLGVLLVLGAAVVVAVVVSASRPDYRLVAQRTAAARASVAWAGEEGAGNTSDIQKPLRPSDRGRAVAAAPAAVIGGPWTFRGPRSINGTASGRVTSIVVDPTSQGQTAYIGTVAGGVWKTTDGGANWVPKSDFQRSLSIGSLAISPDGQTIFAGTGEMHGSTSLFGQGVLKSTNGGNTWTLQGQAQLAGRYIGGMAVDRTNLLNVMAATNAGLYRSIDGGATWILNANFKANGAVPIGAAGTQSGSVYEVKQDPTLANKFWAAVGDGCGTEAGNIAQSTDGGATWANVKTLGANPNWVARPSVGIGTGGAAAKAYVSQADCNGGVFNGQIQKTTDGGATWNPIASPNIAYLGPPFYLGSQGTYDNFAAVDPTNGDHAIFGGVTLISTTDGGATFTDIACVYGGACLSGVHPDMQAAAFTGIADTFYLGNDGGMWKTANLGGDGNAVNWTNLNATLETTEFYYGVAQDLAQPRILGGTQDNGCPGNFGADGIGAPDPALPVWRSYPGCGDGGYTAIDPVAANKVAYTEAQNIFMQKVTNTSTGAATAASPCNARGPNSECIWNGQPADRTPFIAPYVMDPLNPQTIVAGTYRAYRTTNGGTPEGNPSWLQVGPADLTLGFSLGPGDILSVLTGAHATTAGTPWVILSGSEFGKACRSIDGGTTWTDISGAGGGSPLPNAGGGGFSFPYPFISGMDFNRANPNEVWVSLGTVGTPHIWHTLNANAANPTWASVDGAGANALPDAPTAGLVVDPADPNRVFVGTYYGVKACVACGGAAPVPLWASVGLNLPNTSLGWLSLTPDGNTLVAWTRGRSVWSTPKPQGNPTAAVVMSLTAAPARAGVVVSWRTASEVRVAGFDVFRNGSKLNRTLIPAKHPGQVRGASYRFVDRLAKQGSYRLRVVGPTGKRTWYQVPARVG